MPILGFYYYMVQSYTKNGDSLFFLKEFLQKNPDEKVIMTNIWGEMTFLLIEPQCLKDFLVTNTNKMKANHELTWDPFLGENNILISEGEYWKKSRKMHSFAFNYESLIKQTPIMSEIVENFLVKIKNDENINMTNYLYEIVGKFTLRSILGVEFKDDKFEGRNVIENMHHFIEVVQGRAAQIPYMLFGKLYYKYIQIGKEGSNTKKMGRFRKVISDFIDSQTNEIINKKERSGLNLVDHMIKLKLEDPKFKEVNLTDEFLTILATALDTTSTLTLSILMFLSKNQEILKKLFNEIDINIKSEDDFILSKINSLIYLDAVIKETLRIQHPAPLGLIKESMCDVTIGQYNFKKKSYFVPYIYANMLNDKYFKDPLQFQPERWINKDEGIFKNDNENFVFLPFSAGPRNCLGQHFALMETKVMIIKIIKNFEIKMVGGDKFGWTLSTIYHPDKDIIMNLKRRN